MFESALLRRLVDAGGPMAAACLQWLVTGERPARTARQERVDVVWLSDSVRF